MGCGSPPTLLNQNLRCGNRQTVFEGVASGVKQLSAAFGFRESLDQDIWKRAHGPYVLGGCTCKCSLRSQSALSPPKRSPVMGFFSRGPAGLWHPVHVYNESGTFATRIVLLLDIHGRIETAVYFWGEFVRLEYIYICLRVRQSANDAESSIHAVGKSTLARTTVSRFEKVFL
jgi:hypothetical protein